MKLIQPKLCVYRPPLASRAASGLDRLGWHIRVQNARRLLDLTQILGDLYGLIQCHFALQIDQLLQAEMALADLLQEGLQSLALFLVYHPHYLWPMLRLYLAKH